MLLLLAMSLVLLPRELPSLSLFAGTGGDIRSRACRDGRVYLPEPAQVDTAPLIEPTPAVEPATGALPMQQLLDQRRADRNCWRLNSDRHLVSRYCRPGLL